MSLSESTRNLSRALDRLERTIMATTRPEDLTRAQRLEPGRCVCGHKMHSLKAPHACWQHEAGTCRCTEFQGVNGEPFDQEYFRGGKRYDRAWQGSTASNPKGSA